MNNKNPLFQETNAVFELNLTLSKSLLRIQMQSIQSDFKSDLSQAATRDENIYHIKNGDADQEAHGNFLTLFQL